jgi:ribonuclease T2
MPMRMLSPRFFFLTVLVCLLVSGMTLQAKSRKGKASNSSQFSYYLLVLSYAPDFCDQPQGNKDPRECGAGRHVGVVVHGLWPQGETSRGPENCGTASPVSQAIIQATLSYIPTESLIQHEWAAHGTCSGLSAADYFAALRKARDSVTLPADLNQPSQKLQFSPAQIESKIAAANASFPSTAFRTSCYGNGELEEVRICLGKDLSARACGPSAGECAAGNVTLLPVR